MGGAAHFDIPSVGRRSQQFYLDCVAVMLAGLASEQLCLGDLSDGAGGGENCDLAVATRIATYAEAKLGMGASFLHSKAESDEELERIRLHDAGLRARVEKTLTDQFERAKDILKIKRVLLEMLATELDANGFLSPQRVIELEKSIAVSIPSEPQMI
ncbi:hypothetical protein [Agrobacterium sp. B1(2019)]|uniref:hypothetical protein n=1 Tax=Agrobacterium sp. B1(2019) TaxID=2607032 RepID=UPI0011EBE96D|nr:hypothetical protein [Agrobacterium sp. B1(2019)]TZG37068.1 hypothetical protein AGR1_06320 [Agrobacterium sp. B1(2019)]